MPCTVGKRPRQACALQSTPGGGVYYVRLDASGQSFDRGQLRLQDRVVPAANSRGCFTYENGPRDVTAVAAQYSTLVNDDQLVFSDTFRGGVGVWEGGARAGGNDGIEGRAGGSGAAGEVVELGGEVEFGDAGADFGEKLFEYFGGEDCGGAHGGKFGGVLDGAEVGNEGGGGDPFDGALGDALNLAEAGEGDLVRGEGDAVDGSLAGNQGADFIEEGLFDDVDSGGAYFVFGLDGVAAVGKERGRGFGDQEDAAAARKAAEVADVGQMGDQDGLSGQRRKTNPEPILPAPEGC